MIDKKIVKGVPFYFCHHPWGDTTVYVTVHQIKKHGKDIVIAGFKKLNCDRPSMEHYTDGELRATLPTWAVPR